MNSTDKAKKQIEELLSKTGKYSFSDLCKLMEVLRSDIGCPWDREQTNKSIRSSLIEETYEATEGIDTEDDTLLSEELGDVLLQIVFHAQIAKEGERFDIDDITDGICRKLIHRHPHVFGEEIAKTSDKVLINWENIKNEEKGRESATSRLKSVPKTFPALMRAEKVAKRASKVGFDFENAEDAKAKIFEELAEIDNARTEAELAEEGGDLLFAVANFLRKKGVDCEESLTFATEKFISRFEILEEMSMENGRKVVDNSAEELDFLWKRAKMTKKTQKN